MMTKYGLTDTNWRETKVEMRTILIELARQRGTITYGELASVLTTATLHPYAYVFSALLREICEDEELAGRGLMCALVVQKSSGIPGNGFFKHAQQFGRDISDPKQCWQQEIDNLYDIWRTPEGKQ